MKKVLSLVLIIGISSSLSACKWFSSEEPSSSANVGIELKEGETSNTSDNVNVGIEIKEEKNQPSADATIGVEIK